MFKKTNDPLVESVKAVMKENEIRRQAEAALNEELGISSRKALPHEYHEAYDRALQESIMSRLRGENPHTKVNPKPETSLRSPVTIPAPRKPSEAKKKAERDDDITNRRQFEEELKGNQKVLDVAKPKGKLTGADFKALRKNKVEESTSAQQEKVSKTMSEFGKGKLHSGSKTGPKVTDRKQAVAIALNQAGLSKKQNVKEAVIQEIRGNLEEQLAEAYLDSDPTVFENFVDSLTEEQIDILGLSEDWKDIGQTVGKLGRNVANGVRDIGVGFASKVAGPQSALGKHVLGKNSFTSSRPTDGLNTQIGSAIGAVPDRAFKAVRDIGSAAKSFGTGLAVGAGYSSTSTPAPPAPPATPAPQAPPAPPATPAPQAPPATPAAKAPVASTKQEFDDGSSFDNSSGSAAVRDTVGNYTSQSRSKFVSGNPGRGETTIDKSKTPPPSSSFQLSGSALSSAQRADASARAAASATAGRASGVPGSSGENNPISTTPSSPSTTAATPSSPSPAKSPAPAKPSASSTQSNSSTPNWAKDALDSVRKGPTGSGSTVFGLNEEAKPQIKQSLESFLRTRFMKG